MGLFDKLYGALLILIGVAIALLFAYFLLQNYFTGAEPAYPAGVTANLADSNHDGIGDDGRIYAVPCGKNFDIKIFLGSYYTINETLHVSELHSPYISLNGLWRGEDCSIIISDNVIFTCSTGGDTWSDTIWTSGYKPYGPWVKGTINLPDNYAHQNILVKASVTVVSPQRIVNTDKYEEKTEKIDRVLTLYVLTGDEYQQLVSRNDWIYHDNNKADMGFQMCCGVPFFGAIAIGFILSGYGKFKDG